MKTTVNRKSLAGLLSLILMFVLSGNISAQEYDDLYFSKKDRAKASEVVATPQSDYRASLEQETRDLHDKMEGKESLDSYSAKNINPEYIARYKSNEANATNNLDTAQDKGYYVDKSQRKSPVANKNEVYKNTTPNYSNNYYNPYYGYNRPYYMRPGWNVGMGYGMGFGAYPYSSTSVSLSWSNGGYYGYGDPWGYGYGIYDPWYYSSMSYRYGRHYGYPDYYGYSPYYGSYGYYPSNYYSNHYYYNDNSYSRTQYRTKTARGMSSSNVARTDASKRDFSEIGTSVYGKKPTTSDRAASRSVNVGESDRTKYVRASRPTSTSSSDGRVASDYSQSKNELYNRRSGTRSSNSRITSTTNNSYATGSQKKASESTISTSRPSRVNSNTNYNSGRSSGSSSYSNYSRSSSSTPSYNNSRSGSSSNYGNSYSSGSSSRSSYSSSGSSSRSSSYSSSGSSSSRSSSSSSSSGASRGRR